MNSTINNIIHIWEHIDNGKQASINTMPPTAPAYAVALDDGALGVAVEVDDGISVNEVFANVTLNTMPAFSNGANCLVLSSPKPTKGFAALCADFLDPGDSGELRRNLIADPVNWWKGWRDLIGNKATGHLVYDTIAELVSLRFLLLRGYDVLWMGPHAGRYDIDCGSEIFEVKSTTSRKRKPAHIHGLFQLDVQGRIETMIYCRLEKSVEGLSIDSLSSSLVASGYDFYELETSLESLGYPIGRSSRNEKYSLLSMELFSINDSFPHISSSSFINNHLPAGVTNIDYEIELSSVIPNEIIDIDWLVGEC